MLEEDAAKFDAFLKDNDATVQDAQRRADAETATRQVKVGCIADRSSFHVGLSFFVLTGWHRSLEKAGGRYVTWR